MSPLLNETTRRRVHKRHPGLRGRAILVASGSFFELHTVPEPGRNQNQIFDSWIPGFLISSFFVASGFSHLEF
jgi:hypothetical protein